MIEYGDPLNFQNSFFLKQIFSTLFAFGTIFILTLSTHTGQLIRVLFFFFICLLSFLVDLMGRWVGFLRDVL